MRYRVEFFGSFSRSCGILHLEFRDDETAIQFGRKIAKAASYRWIDIWQGDRLVNALPRQLVMDGDKASI